jgi:hypothetical protein
VGADEAREQQRGDEPCPQSVFHRCAPSASVGTRRSGLRRKAVAGRNVARALVGPYRFGAIGLPPTVAGFSIAPTARQGAMQWTPDAHVMIELHFPFVVS